MPKIKLTKTELKAQRDSLKRFQRFLPTLQLKKQQLQMEMRKCQVALDENRERERAYREKLDAWLPLFGSAGTVERLSAFVEIEGIDTTINNIAGVKMPVLTGIRFKTKSFDLFVEEPWIDDALAAIRELIRLQTERLIIEEEYRLIGHELRVTTQRVNLFEKVKIPESRENIRVIQIYLGDMDTAAVGRSKIAKRKIQESAA